MAAYVDYSYYTGTFLGSAIAAADFPRLALRASEQIDLLTYQRASTFISEATDIDKIERIKLATCAVAEEIQKAEASGGQDNITSESIGSYSVSYGAASRAALTTQQKYSASAYTYLASTGLMYKGFYADEQ